MNYKNCKHYKEVVRVLAENLSLDDVNFEIDETAGCECDRDEHPVCELWVTLAFAHDMAPQLGIEHAEQTIANLDSRMKEIATALVSSVGNNREITSESEILPEPKIDNQWYESLTPEQKNMIDKINELDNTSIKESNLSQHELIVKAISEMDIDKLEILVKNNLSEAKKVEFIANLKIIFDNFKQQNDTYLIPHPGECDSDCCSNYRNCGYSFEGNNSKNFYDLVFEEENGNCDEICECYRFKIKDDTIYHARIEAYNKEVEKNWNLLDDDLDLDVEETLL